MKRIWVKGVPGLMVWGSVVLFVCAACSSRVEDSEPITGVSQAISPTCVTIRRGVLGDVHDTFLSGDYPNWAPGADSNLWMGSSSGGGHNVPLYVMDLSPVPSGATVTSASFHPYISWNQNNTLVFVHRIQGPWSEAAATATNFDPANIFAASEGSFLAGDVGFKSVDVTGLVSGWVSGAIPNYGIALVESDSLSHHTFSSEVNLSLRPYLEVCYVEATCDDGVQNQGETGVDCGGPCAACATCNDGVQNQGETAVDCGGPCAACATCNDGVQNQGETAVDCGGPCAACATCNDGVQNQGETAVDCGGPCVACATCNDGVQNQGETAVDCGGPCAACATCNDGIQNQGETGVDCGGPCPVCPSCNDGVQNQGETGVDCGGPCAPCPGTPVLIETGGDGEDQSGESVAVDAAGAIHVVGRGGGSFSLGGGTVSSNGGNVFGIKLDQSGALAWYKFFGLAANEGRPAVAMGTAAGPVYAGPAAGPIDLGGGVLPADGTGHAFTFAGGLTDSGAHVWSRSVVFTLVNDNGYGFSNAVCADALGRSTFVGWFAGPAGFGGAGLYPHGIEDAFIASYNADGVPRWAARFGETGGAYGVSCATDSSGNVVVVGAWHGKINFGAGDIQSTFFGTDIFMVKLNPAGGLLWYKVFQHDQEQRPEAVAVANNGDIVMVGEFRDQINFGGFTLVDPWPSSQLEIFAVKFDANGNHVWSQRFGAPNYDEWARGVAVDASGNIVLGGSFASTVTFGGTVLSSLGGQDAFVAKLDPAGVPLWAKHFGGVGLQEAKAVAVGPGGNVFVTGGFHGTVDFGNGPVSSAGGSDLFLVEVAP